MWPRRPARSITLQRIYRSQTGQSGTYLYLIDERAASASNYTDVIAVNAFQEPLPSANYNAPPDDLTGLISLPNGMMAAFSGRKLYFSEPYRPHAWPEKYILTTDSDIVGLGAMDTSIVVMTEGWPQMVQGSSPDTMQMAKLEQNFPCINARGIVDLGYAIAFPSNEGMAVVRADGSISVPTANIFNRDDWLALSPATMIGSQISGRCALFYQTTAVNGTILTGALLLDLSDSRSSSAPTRRPRPHISRSRQAACSSWKLTRPISAGSTRPTLPVCRNIGKASSSCCPTRRTSAASSSTATK